jgi:glucose/arabinose dehydrogenase
MRTLRALALLGWALALVASPAANGVARRIPPVVASGLKVPADIAAAPGEARRIYVAEQRGTIRIAVGGRTLARPFLDIRPLVKTSLLDGLFGLTFHPRYSQDHRFYVDYVGNDGNVKVVEYRSSGGRALPRSARVLLNLEIGHDHFGGDLAFGPDGKLYVAVGDGEVAADAQNPASPRGKILRLDVDQAKPTTDVVALGLRNPWRFSFDRQTGAMLIGDVGANRWEEIDILRAHAQTAANFGWDLYEGRQRTKTPLTGPLPALSVPITTYVHPRKGCAAVVGGLVYRGRSTPSLKGRYVFGDLCSYQVWSLRLAGEQPVQRRLENVIVPGGVTSFGEGLHGEIYAASLNGKVYRLLN